MFSVGVVGLWTVDCLPFPQVTARRYVNSLSDEFHSIVREYARCRFLGGKRPVVPRSVESFSTCCPQCVETPSSFSLAQQRLHVARLMRLARER